MAAIPASFPKLRSQAKRAFRIAVLRVGPDPPPCRTLGFRSRVFSSSSPTSDSESDSSFLELLVSLREFFFEVPALPFFFSDFPVEPEALEEDEEEEEDWGVLRELLWALNPESLLEASPTIFSFWSSTCDINSVS